MNAPRILLIIGGGIAAYKACELIRLIRKGGGSVTCVLTEGGAHFVTAMTLAALSENPVHTTLWDLKNEVEMGHIQLSRQADLVVVCPATADLMARMAAGIADDLATTLLLATDKPVLAVPAMNVRMWNMPPRRPMSRGCAQGACRCWNPMSARWPAANSAPDACPSPKRSGLKSGAAPAGQWTGPLVGATS
jgi:flavoprotein